MITARLRVATVDSNTYGERVTLQAVYSSDPTSPNYSYSVATPAANLDMYIQNPKAMGQLKLGNVYDLTFHLVELA